MNNLRQLIALFTFICTFNSFCLENDEQSFFKEPLTEYTKKDWKKRGKYNKGIRFFKDANGKDFVLKYQHTPETAIHDTLGARIAADLKIPANQVMLLPAGSSFMGESLPCTATIHTHAPGIEVSDIPEMPYYVNIENGLSSEENLESITSNKMLRNLVAFNFYLNRNDSHRNNTFFNKETNQFFAVDFGNIFHTAHGLPNEDNDKYSPYNEKNKYLYNVFPGAAIDDKNNIFFKKQSNALATEAYDFVSTLKKHDLSLQEIGALKDLSAILAQFATKYPAEKIYDEWIKLAEEAHYTYSPQKKESIEVMIGYNLHECKRLRFAIDTLLIKESRNRLL